MKKIEISKDIISEFIEQKRTKTELCKHLGVSIGVINKHLVKYDLYWPRNQQTSKGNFKTHAEIDKAWLVENWINTDYTLPQLAEKYQITTSLLESRRAYFNLHKPYKYRVDTSILFNAKDPNIAYIAGLLNTDGYFPKVVDSFEISLVGESERLLLQDIADYIKTTAPIAKYGNAHRLRVVQPGIRSFFQDNYNIALDSKTYKTSTPLEFFNESCAKAYVRGCFDGDGCIGSSNYRLTLSTASKTFIEGLRNLIHRYTGVMLAHYQEKRNNSYYPTLAAQGKKAQQVLDWMYSEEGLRLERKYNKYIQVKDIV